MPNPPRCDCCAVCDTDANPTTTDTSEPAAPTLYADSAVTVAMRRSVPTDEAPWSVNTMPWFIQRGGTATPTTAHWNQWSFGRKENQSVRVLITLTWDTDADPTDQTFAGKTWKVHQSGETKEICITGEAFVAEGEATRSTSYPPTFLNHGLDSSEDSRVVHREMEYNNFPASDLVKVKSRVEHGLYERDILRTFPGSTAFSTTSTVIESARRSIQFLMYSLTHRIIHLKWFMRVWSQSTGGFTSSTVNTVSETHTSHEYATTVIGDAFDDLGTDYGLLSSTIAYDTAAIVGKTIGDEAYSANQTSHAQTYTLAGAAGKSMTITIAVEPLGGNP